MNGGKAVLVTGGAGYIGSHACKALSQAGYFPITYDNLSQGHEWAVKWGPLVKGELSDKARLQAAIVEHQPIAVLHFAALSIVGDSVADPARYYRNNVLGTMGLLDVMREHSLSKIVFSSTAAVYGDPLETPIKENHSTAPTNPYGATKLAVERMLTDYCGAYGTSSIALRYFNAAGADPDGETGEAHNPETHLIPLILEAAAGKRADISVFGHDYPTPDGTCVRDYIHVTDLAAAHVRALEHLEQTNENIARTYNLGNGGGFSVQDVIEVARRVTGHEIATTKAAPRAGDPPILVADATRARADLNWRPQYPDLDAQISHAWAWHMRGDVK